jgi:hypothetical protein
MMGLSLRRLRIGCLAALLSFSVHLFLFVPLLLGRASARVSPPPNAELTWVVVAEPIRAVQEPLSLAIHFLSPVVDVPDPVDLAGSLETPAATPNDSVPAYVLKMGALTARIQNAWTLPRDRLAADFNCRVKIRQDNSGTVEEVEFESCDDVESLRASLVRAIEHAAPLPALADEHRTGAAVTLHFAAYAAPTDGRHTVVEPGAGAE